jgi:hypothetical protein
MLRPSVEKTGFRGGLCEDFDPCSVPVCEEFQPRKLGLHSTRCDLKAVKIKELAGQLTCFARLDFQCQEGTRLFAQSRGVDGLAYPSCSTVDSHSASKRKTKLKQIRFWF